MRAKIGMLSENGMLVASVYLAYLIENNIDINQESNESLLGLWRRAICDENQKPGFMKAFNLDKLSDDSFQLLFALVIVFIKDLDKRIGIEKVAVLSGLRNLINSKEADEAKQE